MPDTCNYEITNRDEIYWQSAINTSIRDYRAYFASWYGLKESEWRHGWGWRRYDDHTRAFWKMFCAGEILNRGINDAIQRWRVFKLTAPFDFLRPGPYEPSKPVLLFDDHNKAHVFLRNANGELIHYYYDPFIHKPETSLVCENISKHVSEFSSVPLEDLIFTGNICIIKGPDEDRMRIIGLPGNSPAKKIVMFWQVISSPTGFWGHRLIEPGALADPLYIRDPIAVKSSNDSFHVFGINNDRRIVQYSWALGTGLYQCGILEYGNSEWRANELFSFSEPNGEIHIFTTNDIYSSSPGDLLHYHYRQTDIGWSWAAEDITDQSGTTINFDCSLAWYSWLVINREGTSLCVYGRRLNGEIVRYHKHTLSWHENFVNALAEFFNRIPFIKFEKLFHQYWSAENITKDSESISEPTIFDEGYSIQHRFIVQPHREPFHPTRIFGIDGHGCLIYFYRSPSGWKRMHIRDYVNLPPWEHSSLLLSGWMIAGDGPGASQYVFGVNKSGCLIHFENWLPMQNIEWSTYNIHNPVSFPYNSPFNYNKPSYLLSPSLDPKQMVQHTTPWPLQTHIVALNSGKTRLVHIQSWWNHPWHQSSAYRKWASGYHHDFSYQPEKSDDAVATAYRWSDEIHMKCPAFEDNWDVGPSRRAGTMLHEATHIIRDVSHDDDDGKDRWYHHLLGHEIAVSHSPFQIQVEFWADIAEFPNDNVPSEISSHAKTMASHYLSTKFSNDPGWVVGEPRPWY